MAPPVDGETDVMGCVFGTLGKFGDEGTDNSTAGGLILDPKLAHPLVAISINNFIN